MQLSNLPDGHHVAEVTFIKADNVAQQRQAVTSSGLPAQTKSLLYLFDPSSPQRGKQNDKCLAARHDVRVIKSPELNT